MESGTWFDQVRYAEALWYQDIFGMVLIDPEMRVVDCNDCLAELYGQPRARFVGWRVKEFFPPGRYDPEADIAGVLHTGKPVIEQAIAGVGPLADHQFLVSFLPVPGDDHPSGVLALVRDCTVEREAEREAARTRAHHELVSEVRAALGEAHLDPDRVATLITRRLREFMADSVVVTLLDESSGRVESVAVDAADDQLSAALAEVVDRRPTKIESKINRQIVHRGRTLHFGPEALERARAGGESPLLEAFEIVAVLVVPIRWHGRVLGTMSLVRGKDSTDFNDDEQRLAREVADAVGVALGNAQLFRRLSRIQRITHAMAGNVGFDRLVDALVPQLAETLSVDNAAVVVATPDGSMLEIRGVYGLVEPVPPGTVVPFGQGFNGRVAASGAPVVIEDLSADESMGRLERHGLVSAAGVPISDGQVLGVLSIGTLQRRRFSTDDIVLLQSVADRLAVAIRQSLTETALRESEAVAKSVLDTAADAILTVDQHGAIQSANPAAAALFGYQSAELVGMPIAVLIEQADLQDWASHPIGDLGSGVAGRRLDGGTFPADLSVSEVVLSGGRRLLTAIVRDMTERTAAEDRLRHQALHDDLTGLPNRTLFGEHLDHALIRRGRAEQGGVSVMFLDLDRFKVVNDSLGHAAGDQLLVQVAERLRRAVRPGDLIARLGGDEFAVLLEGVNIPAGVVRVAHRVLHQFDEPFQLDGDTVHTGMTIGIAHTEGITESAADLLRHADAALYLAKERGRGRYEIFDEPMRSWLRNRLQVESELHQAIELGHVGVHYQPQLDLATGRYGCVEALARWHHPVRGLLAAHEFIDLAEDTGLIVPLGLNVIRQATLDSRAWAAELGTRAPRIAVNLSTRQLTLPSVEPLLAAAFGSMEHLSIEITETTLMSDFDRVERHLYTLKERGAWIAVDDFGTGYSSLTYLKRLPVDEVKIDKSFVDRVDEETEDSTIVNAIVHLAHALGLVVVAEGVETESQMDALRLLGCDRLQGHLLSDALPSHDTIALLRGGATP